MARIIIEQACPSCGGRGSVTHPAATEREHLEGLREDQCPACSSTGAVWGSRTVVDLDRLPSRSIEAAAKKLYEAVYPGFKWAPVEKLNAGTLVIEAAEIAIRAFLTDLLGEETK